MMSLAKRGEELIGYPVVNEGMRPKSETQATQHGRFSEYCYERLGMLCFTIELGTRETSAGLDVLTAKEKPYAYTAPYEVIRPARRGGDRRHLLDVFRQSSARTSRPHLRGRVPVCGGVRLGGVCGRQADARLTRQIRT